MLSSCWLGLLMNSVELAWRNSMSSKWNQRFFRSSAEAFLYCPIEVVHHIRLDASAVSAEVSFRREV